ncbi:hypothetical protein K0M31_015426 [Melipona bicolor]|uniref:Uncharacterized protein n=1 Tax=Melipona bicolor TaxID=60889 RepID=A0AA40KF28_9HYME|nr:hypothetical protein K0M31_015426 [Melipona bicolor]
MPRDRGMDLRDIPLLLIGRRQLEWKAIVAYDRSGHTTRYLPSNYPTEPPLPGHDILEIRGSRHKSTDLSNPTGHDLRPI